MSTTAKSFGIVDLADQIDEILASKKFPKDRSNRQSKTLKFWDTILETCRELDVRRTLRNLYYVLASNGIIGKEDSEYDRLGNAVGDLRLLGELEWEAIEDKTRWPRYPACWKSPQAMVAACAKQFRTDYWEHHDVRPEVWVESDSSAGILEPVTNELGVRLMSARGQTSLSFLKEAADWHNVNGQKAVIYIFVDSDRSGLLIRDAIVHRLIGFGVDAEFFWAGVTPTQIEEYGLTGHVSSKKGERGNTVYELEEFHPSDLQEICRSCIEQHIEQDLFDDALERQEQGREVLAKLAAEGF